MAKWKINFIVFVSANTWNIKRVDILWNVKKFGYLDLILHGYYSYATF
jgi:hypothetical protein